MWFGISSIFLLENKLSALEKQNPSLVFIGDSKIATRGSTIQVGDEALPSFPLERLAHGFTVSIEYPWWIFFLTYQRKIWCSIQRACAYGSISRIDAKQKNQKSQIILVPKCSFLLTKKIQAQTWCFQSQIKKLCAFEILKCHSTF